MHADTQGNPPRLARTNRRLINARTVVLSQVNIGIIGLGKVFYPWPAPANGITLRVVKKIVEPILRALSLLPPEGRGQPHAASAGEEAHFAGERRRMVQEQLSSSGHGITDARVRAAMGKVPRHQFVPAGLRPRAYDNGALPIGYGQTISQPFVVAFMTEQLDLQPTDRVLEIGTGSGYQAALLAELAGEVYSIEILEALAQRAGADLKQLGYTNVQLRVGDGCLGWPDAAPFDAIVVTCAPEQRPQPLLEQLRDGGRMIIPVGPDGRQKLMLIRKQGRHLEERAVLPVRFVPMTGRALHEANPSDTLALTPP